MKLLKSWLLWAGLGMAAAAVWLATSLIHKGDPDGRHGPDPAAAPPRSGGPADRAGSPGLPARQRSPMGSVVSSERVAEVVGNEGIDDLQAAGQLLELALDSGVPVVEREEALEHALNLADDEFFTAHLVAVAADLPCPPACGRP